VITLYLQKLLKGLLLDCQHMEIVQYPSSNGQAQHYFLLMKRIISVDARGSFSWSLNPAIR
jgi:hypothetical protein